MYGKGAAMLDSPVISIIDDDPSVRQATDGLVRSLGYRSATFASAEDFLQSDRVDDTSCLITDVQMPGMSGIELQQQLNLRGAVIPVIFITGHGDVPMAVAAMQQGAFDFLQKPFRDQDLIDRIQRALEKDRVNRAELGKRSDLRARHEALTPREREVLALVMSGKANKVMAADLGLSQRTVEVHRARVMEKMGASSLAHLVRMVLDLEESAGPGATKADSAS